jgi:hypothetical protein
MSENENSDKGFSEQSVRQALRHSGFTEVSLTQPFEIEDSETTLPVLMAVARNG